jgi:hypothetical protein
VDARISNEIINDSLREAGATLRTDLNMVIECREQLRQRHDRSARKHLATVIDLAKAEVRHVLSLLSLSVNREAHRDATVNGVNSTLG